MPTVQMILTRFRQSKQSTHESIGNHLIAFKHVSHTMQLYNKLHHSKQPQSMEIDPTFNDMESNNPVVNSR